MRYLLILLPLLFGCGDVQQRQADIARSESQERTNIARIESQERLEMAKLKIVEKYFHEMDRQEKILEVAKMLKIGKKKKGSE